MRVVLATDGSDDARAATEWLTRFPLPDSAAILALSVADVPHSSLDVPTVRDFQQALRDDAARVAEEARATLARRWPGATASTVEGDPREGIVRAAEEWRADLVVLGARGLGGVKGFLLGSVSLGVAHHADCPVLVVKGRPQSLRRVLIAVDGSADAVSAARFFASLPLNHFTRVSLLGVAEPAFVPATAPGYVQAGLRDVVRDLVAERREALETALAGLAAEFEAKGIGVERQVVVGHAGEEIIAAAAPSRTDLVVVGARGLGPLRRVLLGSVSERVLRHAECPVLVVKGASGGTAA